MAKEGITGKENILKHYLDICNIVDGDVSAEVISTDFDGMIREGEELAALYPQIVVKLPMIGDDGIKACKYFSSKGPDLLGEGTNWQNELFQTGLIQNYNLSASGVLLDKENNTQIIKMGHYEFTFKHDYTLNWSDGAKGETWPMSSAIIIEISKDEFYIAGSGIVVTFKTLKENLNAGILKTDQGTFENEKWKTIRHFNGDQTHQGRHLRISVGDYEIQKIKLYTYE